MKVSVNILAIIIALSSVAISTILILCFHPTTPYEVLTLIVFGTLGSVVAGLVAAFLTED